MEDEDKSEGRLSRWSQRKMAVAREEAAEQEAETLETVNADEQNTLDAELKAELQANKEAAEAVDLTELNEESDFSVFMKAGVPEMLKKQAMLALWRTNPIFANIDGLVDYDDDFGSPDLIMKTFKSAYQAGKGYLDLFKEDEETDEEEVSFASNEGLDRPKNELQDDTEEDDNGNQEPDKTVDEHSVVETQEVETPVEELALEEQPLPKVSLRKRLELETQV